MSNLSWEVPLPAIPHPRVPLSTFAIRGRCRGLLPTTVVIPACMPRFHISQEWEMVWCNEVIASLLPQTSSCPLLVKPLGTHDLRPQTIRVGATYLHSSLGVTSQLLGCLEVPLLWPHRRCQDQIWLSLLAQSNWVVYDIDVRIIPWMVSSSNSLGSCCCMKTQSVADACPNYLDIPSRKLWAYLPEFGWLARFGHPFVGDRPNCGSSESPMDACRCSQKRAINCGPRSEMMIFGTPCKHNMWAI
jgi:hypothetical protein